MDAPDDQTDFATDQESLADVRLQEALVEIMPRCITSIYLLPAGITDDVKLGGDEPESDPTPVDLDEANDDNDDVFLIGDEDSLADLSGESQHRTSSFLATRIARLLKRHYLWYANACQVGRAFFVF